MNKKYMDLLDHLKREVISAIGCTEPVAVAYAGAEAGKLIENIDQIRQIEICADAGLFKNVLRVGIPGIKERGIEISVALGIVIAKPENGLLILGNVSSEELSAAKKLVEDRKINVSIRKNCDRLFVEVMISLYSGEMVKVVIIDKHQNVVKIEKGFDLKHEQIAETEVQNNNKIMQENDLFSLIEFADNVDLDEILFLKQGIEMNMQLAEEGFKIEKGIGAAYIKLIENNTLQNNIVMRPEALCAAAAEARMSGSRLPAMSCASSGNHGITVFLSIAGVAEAIDAPEDKVLRALALASLVTAYIKSFTGVLSAMCGCGVAAGIGATAGMVYMMGGDEDRIYKGILNMVGTVSGLICDGGKEGCAYKIAVSVNWAVKSALLAMEDTHIDENNGILAKDPKHLFENLAHVCRTGMSNVNESIINVMLSSEYDDRD